MNKITILKQLLPGLAPLLVFFAVDAIWGTLAGIVVAVISGIGWLAWTGIKEKKLDRFALLDTILLVILGSISIGFDNELFFKLKPGLIGIIFCGLLAYAGFFSTGYITGMAERYFSHQKINTQQIKQMQKSMQVMFYLFSAHTVLVFYAAFFMSKASWAFISGGLFYIIFGVYFLAEFIRTRWLQHYLYRKDEWVPVVDNHGNTIGKAPRQIVHNGSKILHPVVHVHILNQKKEIYLQKRSVKKEIQPGKWDTAVGGHFSAGESVETALKREISEETGLQQINAVKIATYIWESEIEREWVNMFIAVTSQKPVVNTQETDDGRFWSINEIEKNTGKGIFTPNFELEFTILKKVILSKEFYNLRSHLFA